MKNLTIVYIHDKFTDFGGVERIFIDKMNYLVDHYGYNIIMLSYMQENNNIVFNVSPNIHYYDLNIPIYLQFRYGYFKRFFYYKRMQRLFIKRLHNLINKNQVDILVGTTYDFFLLEVLNKLRHEVKIVIETHTYRKFIQGDYECSNFFRELFHRYRCNKISNIVKKADAFVTLTKGDSAEWSDIRRCVIIPNSLINKPQICKPIDKDFKRVVSVGRLEPQKGFDMLLQAWSIVNKYHPDWHLDVYGKGSMETKLNNLCESLKLEGCVNINNPTNDIYEQYCSSDLCVMSSHFEGFGMVLIEAMSCGIPCISFNCPYGPSEIINDGVDGLLVEKDNVKELANGICYMIENKGIRHLMGVEAEKNVLRFSPDLIMTKWKDLFESLVTK